MISKKIVQITKNGYTKHIKRGYTQCVYLGVGLHLSEMTKKEIPLSILKTLEKFVNLKGEKFIVSDSNDFLMKIKDVDENSSFQLLIEKQEIKNGNLEILLITKPTSDNNNAPNRRWIKVEKLTDEFEKWLNILDGYEKTYTFFDDPIIKSFAEDYYIEFEVVDENANVEPLKPKQILLLDKHLEFIEKNIGKYENEENKVQLEEIKNDVSVLRDNLTNKSKAWVIKNLSTIWAKLTKQGTKFIKEFLSESRKQAIKEGVKYLIEQGTDLIT